ncbi:MAG: MBL fold metallo-hydrolase [Mesotoga sp.]|uniref:MBL fold metallo-hydrolase n=2 Tax=Mesotoga sp. TaxID=2053577 RepID=UPI002616C7E0|nr:MBL fold metallo-hydrolase [Mesotoga sp.]MDD2333396.1 MBL fold metallo-hydrolase [Mesotoga sp.]MDD3682078.1 MBL fold metallo-hydrolase [Mesotoga sp.]MDD4208212.1 MBL fold metallo-hydrolase [Mesotoga sp.]
MDMRITVLCNDKAIEGFECEHGVSFFVEMNGKNYLFDTGSTDVAVKNARKLGLNLSRIELIVISHGHYDHLGGLGSALRETGAKKVLVGEGSFERKFSETTLTSPEDGRTEYERLGAIIETVWTSKEIADGVYVMTAAPLVTKERPGEKHVKITEGITDRDLFNDELSLSVVENGNVTVITGCSHRGIGNIVKQASGFGKVKNVVGGLHLLHKTEDELEEIFGYLLGFDIDKFHIGHCTGDNVVKKIAERFPAEVRELMAGDSFEFHD